MHKYKCQYCRSELEDGNFLNWHSCPYCGAVFEIAGNQIVIFKGPQTDIVQSETIFSTKYEMGDTPYELSEKLAKENIIRKLAEALEPYITYDKEYDPILCATRLRGAIRILPKDFKFYSEDEA